MKVLDIMKTFGWMVVALATTISPCGGQQAPECGAILGSWTAEEAKATLVNAIENIFGSSGGMIKSFVLPLLKYGVQFRKVCAVCSDFMEDCGYGGDVPHSGLLLIPLADDNSTDIAEGTHKGVIYNHGTRTASQPSTDWKDNETDTEILFNAIFAAATRSVVVMPDFMGQGESYGQVFRGYLVRKAYEASVVPLYMQAQTILEEETKCSALGDSVFVMGYSEGGYASMAVGDKLNSLGYDIIRVDAGGAPLWVSGALIVDMLGSFKNGTFPWEARHLLPIFGFSFSSTYEDMPNYGMGQDMLTNSSRAQMLDIYSSEEYMDNEYQGREAVSNIVPVDNMLSVFDPDYVNLVDQAVSNGEKDPCSNGPIEGVMDHLCESLQAQDLHKVLQDATYPVVACHSPDDDVVAFGNLPDVSGNPKVTVLESSGGHTDAIGPCWFNSIQFVLSSDFLDYVVEEKTDAMCRPGEGTTTTDPETAPPTEKDPSASSSITVRGVTFGFISLALLLAGVE